MFTKAFHKAMWLFDLYLTSEQYFTPRFFQYGK